MASIQAGFYTVDEILNAAKFNFREKAAADYLDDAPDFRRVQIGGLGFDSLEDVINIPVTADEVVITLDGKSDTVLDVTLTEQQQEQRTASFESAADTDDPALRVTQPNE